MSYEKTCKGVSQRIGAVATALTSPMEASRLLLELGSTFGTLVAHTLGGKPIRCDDVKSMASSAHGTGRLLVADNSLATSFGCPAVRRGADLVVERASLASGGIVAVSVSDKAPLMLREAILGVAPAADGMVCEFEAHLAKGGLRWRRTSDCAQVVASYLACHPMVGEVRYPGLKSDPSFDVAAVQLIGGFGPVMDVRISVGEWRRITCEPEDPREAVLRIERSLASSA